MRRHKVRRQRSVHRREVRRALEPLEPRTLMAVFTVNSAADILSPPSGTVTLRSAIQAANRTPGPDTINLPLAGTYKINLLGSPGDNTSGAFAIYGSGDLTIQNTSGRAVIVDGGGFNRVFEVESASPVTVTFAGLVVTDGFTNGDGGGIGAAGPANVVLNGCDIEGNLTTSGGGGIASGGSGALTLNGTRVAFNRAAGAGGGGIAGLGTGTVTIGPGSVITENTVLGIILARDIGGSGGGGIWVDGAPLNVVGATVSDNRTIAMGPITPLPGGGIMNTGAGAVTITGSIIQDNTADGLGGGYDDAGLSTLNIRNSFILDNTSGKSGGGLAAGGSFVSLTNVTVAGNVALTPAYVALSPDSVDGGGGLYISGTGTTRVIDSTISGNTSDGYGGGIYTTGAAKLMMTGSTLSGNHALGTGAYGGGLAARGGLVAISNGLFRNNAAPSGGGLYLAAGSLEIAASRFTGNAAGSGGAIDAVALFSITGSTFDANRAGYSGALAVDEVTLGDSLTNSTIVGNQSDVEGAVGLTGEVSVPVTMTDDTIDGNACSEAGSGGLYLGKGYLAIQGTIIANNTAAGVPSDFDYVGGAVTDRGGNLLGTKANSGAQFGPGTIVADPKLGPLEDNGGQSAGAPFDTEVVPTQALLPGSPAFSAGVAFRAPTTDERGFARRPSPSIGAYQPLYSGAAPINAVFVEDLYETLLGRSGDQAGLAAGFNFLNGGGTPTALVQVFQSSNEFLGREASRIVRRYLDRTPSPAEVGNVVSFLASGHTPEQAASIFINSAEFAQDYGNSQDIFLEAMYQTRL